MRCKAGKEVMDALAVAYKADMPVLLEGPHGVGKSEMVAQAARELGVGCVVCDLSLMEPPDLVGLPIQQDGKTVYAPPKFLPTSGRGILVFEELNRSEKYMRSPCLQLLTARKLNDYTLPAGWLPMAAINPDGAGYEVTELDPALMSRFLRLQVVADVDTWLPWAEARNIHPAVMMYVKSLPRIFDTSNPRSWTFVSKTLVSYEGSGTDDRRLLLSLVAGLVGEAHGKSFVQIYRNGKDAPIDADQILRRYPSVAGTVAGWAKAKKTDRLDGVAHNVLVKLQDSDVCNSVAQNKRMTRNLEAFIEALPADIGKKVRRAALDGGALS